MKKTILHDSHVALGASMQSYGGFDMPTQYTSINEEHDAVRNHVGVFDASHMGEIAISGHQAVEFTNHIVTNDVSKMETGDVIFSMICRPDGGIVDDVRIAKLEPNRYFLTINSENIDKDNDWIHKQAKKYQVVVCYKSGWWNMLAVQGPEAVEKVSKVLHLPCSDIAPSRCKEILRFDSSVIISRSGLTGLDGFEIYGDDDYTRDAWGRLLAAGVKPCGLGCLDILRFEAGLPRYGNELSEDVTPVMAGLTEFVDFGKAEFIGRDALLKQKEEGVAKCLQGIQVEGDTVPVKGDKVLKDGKETGEVTTAYHLIAADKTCAMALVGSSLKLGDSVEVLTDGKRLAGTIVKMKFTE